MKKWQIITISSAFALVLLIAGGMLFYKMYIVPKYLEPVVNRVSEYLSSEDVLDELYSQAERLHEGGVLDDQTYVDFIQSYKKHNQNSEQMARAILGEKEDSSLENDESNSQSTRYAANRIGVEIIKTNDDDNNGKASLKYSTERTSDRIKAEDIVEAEKILSEENKEQDEMTAEDIVENRDVESAYSKLKNHMTKDEFSLFVSIMQKMDIGTLTSYTDGSNFDKAGLQKYMHSLLTDKEYSQIVNLGYKYAYVFLD